MTNILNIISLVVSLLLMLVILLQSKGSGLGTAFGGSGASFSSRRGVEKILYRFTIILAVLFLLIPLINIVFIQK